MKFEAEKLLLPTLELSTYGAATVARLIYFNITRGPVPGPPVEWAGLLGVPPAGAEEVAIAGLTVNVGDAGRPAWYYRPLFEQVMAEKDRHQRRSKINQKNAQKRWDRIRRETLKSWPGSSKKHQGSTST